MRAETSPLREAQIVKARTAWAATSFTLLSPQADGLPAAQEEQKKLQKSVCQQLRDKERLLGQRKPWPLWALNPARCSRTKSAQRPHMEGTQTPLTTLAGHTKSQQHH